MVELRKRKAPSQNPATKNKSKRLKETASEETSPTLVQSSKEDERSTHVSHKKPPTVGDTIDLDNFGGEVELNDGTKTTLKHLVDTSKSGIVLFTYPRASTPGCTKQACLFRDKYDYITSTGLSIYGLSADSIKANSSFKAKQSLPYPLLCDTASTLISSLGFKKTPRGTTRGVFAVDKQGKVLLLQPGGPDATVDAVQQLISACNIETHGQIKE
ncbi:thioredoxin peroxidase dot5 [Aspergillus fumigatus]|uniref:thioredoxin-dependent peroxiredoxin n=2 Tax=Aspergillus fumigatus TaxID=746128 RepID=A4D9N6_ASPFU|nr:disrupter of telomere silencing protein Dot5, putative [Aspergillus fumigatus Af293]EBA27397.1 disrupter of telomere silencing protein Dot5, putative [Aspergillus fumigatus Af293]EDP49969.1 nuclear thiol peroxidase Dot5, putative [Aspergillus fumigatus A1163]